MVSLWIYLMKMLSSPPPTNQPDYRIPDFFVHIIESNRVDEVIAGLREGEALKNVLKFSNVDVEYNTSFAEQDFAITIARNFSYAQKKQQFPIIHIAAHGSEHGVHLTTGSIITWPYLASVLAPLHHLTNGRYLLCLSACRGLNSINIARVMPQCGPLGFVGTPDDVNWNDTVVGYCSFYHLLRKGMTISQSVAGMNAACGHGNYHFLSHQFAVTCA
jgi:hypothetical protein